MRQVTLRVGKMKVLRSLPFVSPYLRQPSRSEANFGGITTLCGETSGIPAAIPAGFNTSSIQFVGMRQVPLRVGKMKVSGSLPFVSPYLRQPSMSEANFGGITTLPCAFNDGFHSLTLCVLPQNEGPILNIGIPFSVPKSFHLSTRNSDRRTAQRKRIFRMI